MAVRNSYSENMWNVCQALLAVHSLLHGLESAALPIWADPEAEEFCRNGFGNNHREGGEVYTLTEMRSGGSTCAVGGCAFVTGWWCFAALRVRAD